MSTQLRDAPTAAPLPAPPPLGEAAGRLVLVLVGVVLIGGGLVLGGWLWTIAAIDVEESTATYDPTGRLDLDLRTDGAVEVRVHDRDDIVVETRTETVWQDVEVSASETDGVLRLRSETCRRWWVPLDRCSASFVVTVPADTAVTGTLRHGAVTVAGVTGAVDLETRHGAVELRDLGGDVTVLSRHGAIAAERIDGRLIAETRHGRIELTDVLRDADVRTRHGAVTVLRGLGALRVATDHGRVEVIDTGATDVTLTSGHGAVSFSSTSPPGSLTVATQHGAVDVAVPTGDDVVYAVTTSSDQGREAVLVPTGSPTQGVAGRIDVRTSHGAIEVRPRTG